VRRYPNNTTEMQRKMLHKVEHEPGYVPSTLKTRNRLALLVQRGFIVELPNGRHTLAKDILPQITYFIQEAGGGDICIGVSHTHKIVDGLQAGNPRKIALLGAFSGDRMRDMLPSIKRHSIIGNWYSPHRDVIRWTKHIDFSTVDV